MSTITKPRTNSVKKFFEAFGSIFGSGIDIEVNEEKLPEELNAALKALANKEANVEQAINVDSSKKGGLKKKMNPIENKFTEKAMRAMHKEVQKSVEDRERE